MRRSLVTLALALCALLAFGALAEPADDCLHENTTYVDFIDGYERIVSANASGHTLVFIRYQMIKCVDCGSGLDVVDHPEGNFTGFEEHDFWNDVCQVCEWVYDSECEHVNMTQSDGEVRVTFANWYNNAFHTLERDFLRSFICGDCGKTVRTETVYLDPLIEAHAFNDNSFCAACYFTCYHAETESRRTVTNSYVSAYGALNHEFFCEYEKQDHCAFCGKVLGSAVSDGSGLVESPHTFGADGGCTACDYVKPADCSHANTEERTQLSGAIATSYDENGHTIERTYVVRTFCQNCLTYVGETVPAPNLNDTVTEPHSMSEGRCNYCAYNIGCLHENTVNQEYQSAYAYASAGADGHDAIGDIKQVTRCLDCDTILPGTEVLVETNVARRESHSFSNGACELCGYVNQCAHADTEIFDQYQNYTVSSGGLNGCISRYDLYQRVGCRDCGESLSEFELIEEGVEEIRRHYFNAQHICENCGYVNECLHEHAIDENGTDEVNYINPTETDHTMSYVLDEWTACADCGERLSEVTQRLVEIVERHTLVNNVCEYCNYVSACPHANLSGTTYVEAREYTPKDDIYHIATGPLMRETYCDDCNAYLGVIQVEPSASEEWYHYYEGDTCVDCFHVNACQHEQTRSFAQRRDITCTESNAEKHVYISDFYTVVICERCNTWLSETPKELGVTIEEAHNFYYDFCSLCNWQNDCPHPSFSIEMYYNENYTVTGYDADGHTITREKWEWDTCAECGETRGDMRYDPVYSYVEDHVFEGGVCVWCAYEKPVPAAPEPVIEPISAPEPEPLPGPSVPPVVDAEPIADMPIVEAMLSIVDQLESFTPEGDGEPGAEPPVVNITVVNIEMVVTEEENEILKQLPVKEQVLVLLAAIGNADAVNLAVSGMENGVSAEAAALIEGVVERLAQMDESARAAFEASLAESFPVIEVEIDGVITKYFVIELLVEVDGVAHIERFGFRFDEEIGDWRFESIDAYALIEGGPEVE